MNPGGIRQYLTLRTAHCFTELQNALPLHAEQAHAGILVVRLTG